MSIASTGNSGRKRYVKESFPLRLEPFELQELEMVTNIMFPGSCPLDFRKNKVWILKRLAMEALHALKDHLDERDQVAFPCRLEINDNAAAETRRVEKLGLGMPKPEFAENVVEVCFSHVKKG